MHFEFLQVVLIIVRVCIGLRISYLQTLSVHPHFYMHIFVEISLKKCGDL